MKRLITLLFFATFCVSAGWADERAGADIPAEPGFSITIDTDDSDEARAESRVLDRVREAIAADPDLSDEEKVEISADLEDLLDFGGGINDGMGFGQTLVASLAIVLLFGMPIILVAIFLYSGYKKRRLVRDMVHEFVASGQAVPPEVWEGLAAETNPRSNLHKGMILVGVGAGIFACFALMGEFDAAYLALIPLFIGAAQLLIWLFERRKEGAGA
jgi:hypothetical protein